MKKDFRDSAVWLLRSAGELLEGEAEKLFLPGWDEENESDPVRIAGIKVAARAIAADDKTADGGTEIRLYNLGFLIRYLGDLLEE